MPQRRHSRRHLSERLPDIASQVVGVLNSHAKTDNAIRNSSRLPNLQRHTRVSHTSWMRAQRFHAPQALRTRKDAHAGAETTRCFLSAIQFQTDHSAETPHL